jgi:ABC-type nitrate/sulfonate/bicarbonate transport system permease component
MSLIESLPRIRAPKLPRADGLIPWIVPLAIILIWQVACVTGFVSARVLPAPSDVAIAGWKLASVNCAQHLGQFLARQRRLPDRRHQLPLVWPTGCRICQS